jgi:hypothetical protein
MMPVNQQTLDTVGMQYVLANLGPNTLSGLNLTVSADAGHLTLHATGEYTPQIASILGIGTFPVGAHAEAKWSLGKVEIALVLDLSLSMNTPSARIQALRAATNDLINVLEDAEREPGDAKVAIAGFDGMVNINNAGYTHSTAPSWIRWDWWDANAYDSINNRCSINFNVSNVPAGTWLKAYCESRSASSCVGAWGSTQWQCQNNGGKWVTTNGVWTSLSRSNWTGCVYDRDQSTHDVGDAAPTSTNSTKYPAAKCYGTAPQAITALNSNWSSLRSKAKSLTPTGYTNITIGMVWGWHLLSPTSLYTEGASYDTENLTKYIILMTDGDNTKNRAMEPKDCMSNLSCAASNLDPRTSAVCTKIKDAGIKIYSVRLIDGNANLIRNCASDPSMYYDVQDASQLSGVFSSIGAEIASLHLSK